MDQLLIARVQLPRQTHLIITRPGIRAVVAVPLVVSETPGGHRRVSHDYDDAYVDNVQITNGMIVTESDVLIELAVAALRTGLFLD